MILVGVVVGAFYLNQWYGARLLTPIWKRSDLTQNELFFALHEIVGDPRWQVGLPGLWRKAAWVLAPKESRQEALMDAVNTILMATYVRLKRRYTSSYGEDHAGFVAAAILNEMSSTEPSNAAGAAFSKANADLISKGIESIKQDIEVRIAMTHAFRFNVIANRDKYGNNDKFTVHQLMRFGQLGISVPEVPVLWALEFLSFAEKYRREDLIE